MSHKKKRSNKHVFALAVGAVGLVVILGLAFGGDSGDQASNETEINTELIQQTVEIGDEEVVLGESVVDETIVVEEAETDAEGEIVDEAAAKNRDKQRVEDVKAIREAMEKFYKDNEAYPGDFVALVPDYLSDVPTNPSPGGVDYSLTGIGAEIEPGTQLFAYYDMVYALEVGADGIEPGIHVANPDGIALP